MIDYLSLDVEKAEDLVLLQFPFDRYRFRIINVETVSAELNSYLEANGYKLLLSHTDMGFDSFWAHESWPEGVSALKQRLVFALATGKEFCDKHNFPENNWPAFCHTAAGAAWGKATETAGTYHAAELHTNYLHAPSTYVSDKLHTDDVKVGFYNTSRRVKGSPVRDFFLTH